MDPSPPPAKPVAEPVEQDWDADDFEIPSLKAGKGSSDVKEKNSAFKGTPYKDKIQIENVYLGPHGAPPSQLKQQELNTSKGKKNQRKQKIKEVDKKSFQGGRENKVDALQDLMGSKGVVLSAKGTQNDWLDPHCHESQFERLS